ncbi:T9SS type A sorting domain-containing protein [Crocinitomicaceae bacterium]|nr:T9SS type A sorting domain-containing protein [Crocinitomicaceae bacterium]
MKNFLLSIAALTVAGALNAQIYSCADSIGFAAWTSYDNDGDGFGWSAIDFTGATNPLQSAAGGCAVSYSYDNASTSALTPDNIFVSPAVDLSGVTGSAVSLSWEAGSSETTASGWFEETYAVYAILPTDLPGLLMGVLPSPIYSGTLSAGEVMENRFSDISSLIGESEVYFAVRHFNCTDEFILIFDNFEVDNASANIEETKMEATVYPNPATDVLNFSLNVNAEEVSIRGLDGKLISSEKVNGMTGTVNISKLTAGTYFYEFSSSKGTIRNTFIKYE